MYMWERNIKICHKFVVRWTINICWVLKQANTNCETDMQTDSKELIPICQLKPVT